MLKGRQGSNSHFQPPVYISSFWKANATQSVLTTADSQMPLRSLLMDLVSHLDLQFSLKLESSASHWEGNILQSLRAKLEWAGGKLSGNLISDNFLHLLAALATLGESRAATSELGKQRIPKFIFHCGRCCELDTATGAWLVPPMKCHLQLSAFALSLAGPWSVIPKPFQFCFF